MLKPSKKIAVVLSGCGFLDGTEITEAVSTLIALDKENSLPFIFAPDVESKTMNHFTKTGESPRNALHESARIARGEVRRLSELDEKLFDALVFPGGAGASQLLCNWSDTGAQCHVLPDLQKIILAFHSSSKPIGAMCIAPVILARVLGRYHITVTIGNNTLLASEIEKTGALHEICPVHEYVSDRSHKILTTPAYMIEARSSKVFEGISKMIRELVEMA